MEQLGRNNWLSAAGFLFERRRGIALFEHADDLIAFARLEDADIEAVSAEIVRLLESGDLDAAERGTAYWALGKIGHNRLASFVRDRLAFELGDMRVAIQAMFTLGNWGEPVFAPGRTGISWDEDELNLRDARAYLACFR